MKQAPLFLLTLFVLPVIHAAPILRVNGEIAGNSSHETFLGKEPLPTWVWGKDHSHSQFLRRSFEVKEKPVSARLEATCDNVMTVWINGQEVAKSSQWQNPVNIDIL